MRKQGVSRHTGLARFHVMNSSMFLEDRGRGERIAVLGSTQSKETKRQRNWPSQWALASVMARQSSAGLRKKWFVYLCYFSVEVICQGGVTWTIGPANRGSKGYQK